jgi:uncharacterized Fe-S center protein
LASPVFFTDARAVNRSLLGKLDRLLARAGLDEVAGKNDLVAVKLHFGERGTTRFLRPQFVRPVVERLRRRSAKPFLTDANTLYKGGRSNAVDHLETAIQHGFDYAVVGAPLVIADGLTGKDYVRVKISGKHFREVHIASAVYFADALVVLSHFKGHESTGFGGALKNLGMGCGARSGKQQMHSDVLPEVDPGLCRGCGRCRRWCPADAIYLEGAARIDPNRCLGCGECVVTCPHGAIAISWKAEPQNMQEKIVEYALGALKEKDGRAFFVNFVLEVTPDCDCFSGSDVPLVPDVGILASKDPVALDQACYDLVTRQVGLAGTRLTDRRRKAEGTAPGQDKFFAVHGIDPTPQLSYAEALGLGTREYELVRVR